MKNIIRHIVWGMMSLLAIVSCDVHEVPTERKERVPFFLNLEFDTELPLHQEIAYSRNVQESKMLPLHDVRYIINAYRDLKVVNENLQPDTTFVFTSSEVYKLNRSLMLELPEGTYTFNVWVDFVASGTQTDKYYDTSNFNEIILADKANHPGSNDYRDAFRGSVTASIVNPDYYTGSVQTGIDNQFRVEMKRPMGKYKFISTDLDVFLTRVAKTLVDQGIIDKVESKATYEELLQLVELDEYEVVFRYNIFMPCSFNMFTDKPADSWTGMSFKSLMQNDGTKEITLGYDYIFVNGTETTLSVSVEVYNSQGELISSSKPIDVPVVRSKLTVVRGDFLTSKASGGISINPGFDGPDYNIEIK